MKLRKFGLQERPRSIGRVVTSLAQDLRHDRRDAQFLRESGRPGEGGPNRPLFGHRGDLTCWCVVSGEVRGTVRPVPAVPRDRLPHGLSKRRVARMLLLARVQMNDRHSASDKCQPRAF